MYRLLLLLIPIMASSAQASGPTGLLNDTGQDTCYDGGALVVCSVANAGDGATYPRQDGRFGRDQAGMAKVGGGAAGFDFSKICMNGEVAGSGTCPANPVPSNGSSPSETEWACTRDNVTHLVWSLQSASGINWADAISTASGSLIDQANTANGGVGRCGLSSGWRVPTRRELLSVTHRGASFPAIDPDYFPGTASSYYWSSDAYAPDMAYAWSVNFDKGTTNADSKAYTRYVRLVRNGP